MKKRISRTDSDFSLSLLGFFALMLVYLSEPSVKCHPNLLLLVKRLLLPYYYSTFLLPIDVLVQSWKLLKVSYLLGGYVFSIDSPLKVEVGDLQREFENPLIANLKLAGEGLLLLSKLEPLIHKGLDITKHFEGIIASHQPRDLIVC